MPPDDAGLTRDAWLDGRLMLWQPARGYRAGVDPVLLAAACPARPGESVLELGCGTGTAALCLATRVPGLSLTGVERQPEIAAIARRNAAEAGLPLTVVEADLACLPAELRQRSFDHVIANPPYFDRASSLRSGNPAREAAMGEETQLAVWTDTAAARLKQRGWLTIIHRPERLPDLLACVSARFGSLRLLPLIPREGRDASLILLRARKGGRAPPKLHAPVVLHCGARHESDAEDYTAEARRVLRGGKALMGFGD